MRTSDLSRRQFMQRFVAVGAIGLGSGTLLAACGGGETAPQGAAATAPACSDLTGLTEQEVAMRTQLQYVAVSADPAKHCVGCALYVVPVAGAACGGCTLIKGPIAPEGSCLSWAAKAT
jgi:hypothetical protein